MNDITAASLQVVGRSERRRPGRPRIEEERSSVSAWIPATHHDRLVQMAKQQEKSVSALIGEILLKELVG